MSKFIIRETIDSENKHLTIEVSADAIRKLKEILSKNKPIGKAFGKLVMTYAFLHWLAKHRITHVRRDDMAEMIYSKHEDRLKSALQLLKEYGLIDFDLNFNNNTQRSFYTYKVFFFDYPSSFDATITFEYDIPELMAITLFKKKADCVLNDSSKQPCALNPSLSSPSNPTADSLSSILTVEEETFREKFVCWYDELSINGVVVPQGHFSQKDHRYYHLFHSLSKSERFSLVSWDGEHVIEVWDAHSAFFLILGYYLKNFKEYESETERKAFNKEADSLIDMAFHNRLYDDICEYQNDIIEMNYYTRDYIKQKVQMYKNLSYDYLFKKNGEIKGYRYTYCYKYIDEYFRIHFPNIREMLLHYPSHKEPTNRYRLVESEYQPIMKSISNIQRDILPYEFKLISMGLCRDLSDLYKVKSITVHDAIYMKASDARRKIDINNLLALKLGLGGESVSYALF